MARYKHIDISPRFLAVDLEKQVLPGSFAHAFITCWIMTWICLASMPGTISTPWAPRRCHPACCSK